MLDEETRKKLVARMRRAEGQLAAIRRMIENDEYCVDILLQLSAARGALGKAGHVLLGYHIENCVSDACKNGDEKDRRQKVQELMDVFARYGGLQR